MQFGPLHSSSSSSSSSSLAGGEALYSVRVQVSNIADAHFNQYLLAGLRGSDGPEEIKQELARVLGERLQLPSDQTVTVFDLALSSSSVSSLPSSSSSSSARDTNTPWTQGKVATLGDEPLVAKVALAAKSRASLDGTTSLSSSLSSSLLQQETSESSASKGSLDAQLTLSFLHCSPLDIDMDTFGDVDPEYQQEVLNFMPGKDVRSFRAHEWATSSNGSSSASLVDVPSALNDDLPLPTSLSSTSGGDGWPRKLGLPLQPLDVDSVYRRLAAQLHDTVVSPTELKMAPLNLASLCHFGKHMVHLYGRSYRNAGEVLMYEDEFSGSMYSSERKSSKSGVKGFTERLEESKSKPEVVFVDLLENCRDTAQYLLNVGVPHVVCKVKEDECTTEDSLAFAGRFWSLLANGSNVQEAFDQALVESSVDSTLFVLLPEGEEEVHTGTTMQSVTSSTEASASSSGLQLSQKGMPDRLVLPKEWHGEKRAYRTVYDVHRFVKLRLTMTMLRRQSKKLMVLYGSEGCGKSHFAAVIAQMLNDRRVFGGGVVWVSLEQVSTVAEFERALAVCLGAQMGVDGGHTGGVDVEALLREQTQGGKSILLVLDGAQNLLKAHSGRSRADQQTVNYLTRLLQGNVYALITCRGQPMFRMEGQVSHVHVPVVRYVDEVWVDHLGADSLYTGKVYETSGAVLHITSGNAMRLGMLMELLKREWAQGRHIDMEGVFTHHLKELEEIIHYSKEVDPVDLGDERANTDWALTFGTRSKEQMWELFVQDLNGSPVYTRIGDDEDDLLALRSMVCLPPGQNRDENDFRVLEKTCAMLLAVVAPYSRDFFVELTALAKEPYYHGYETTNAVIGAYAQKHGPFEDGAFLVRISVRHSKAMVYAQGNGVSFTQDNTVVRLKDSWQVSLGQHKLEGSSLRDLIDQGVQMGILNPDLAVTKVDVWGSA